MTRLDRGKAMSPTRVRTAASSRRAARLVDIAEAVGVHVSTVSRVLNGDPRLSIRPETLQRILAFRHQEAPVPRPRRPTPI